MNFKLPKISFPFFERTVKGDTFYDVKEFAKWGLWTSNLDIAQNHPILTPALLFLCKLYSQAEFYIENKKTGEKIHNHWLLQLIDNPNYYQTKNDFLETQLFIQIAEGQSIGWVRRTTGLSEPTAIYLLDPLKIKWPQGFNTKYSRINKNNSVQKEYIIYDEHGQNERIQIKDLLFWYDMPNAMDGDNMFNTGSRLDGIRQTLLNTVDSLIAKNIILKSNGKELITGGAGSGGSNFPLTNLEKENAEKLVQNEYGLSFSRTRGLVTNANIKWQSLHIALRDLGLDESVKVDGNIVYTALHIPKDIISLEAKKTTYNNFKESMVSFIQNEMQPTINSFLTPFNRILDNPDLQLRANYNSMPIMQFILIEKYDGLIKKGQALSALRSAGLPDDIALTECGYDKNIKLKELIPTQIQNQNGEESGNQGEENEEDNED